MDNETDDKDFEASLRAITQTLPAPIREYLASGEYSRVAQALMQKYALHVDQGGLLERKILLLLLGLDTPQDFADALTQEGKLSSENVNKIIADVNQQIFVPLHNKMRAGGGEEHATPAQPSAPQPAAPAMQPKPEYAAPTSQPPYQPQESVAHTPASQPLVQSVPQQPAAPQTPPAQFAPAPTPSAGEHPAQGGQQRANPFAGMGNFGQQNTAQNTADVPQNTPSPQPAPQAPIAPVPPTQPAQTRPESEPVQPQNSQPAPSVAQPTPAAASASQPAQQTLSNSPNYSADPYREPIDG